MDDSISPQEGGREEDAGEAFGRSQACFENLVAVLADPQGGRMTHAQMEDQLIVLSRELLQVLHQDSLDLREARERRREPVTGSDEVRRGIVERGHDRGLASVFGKVTVTRMAYRHRGAENLYPADALLNLPEDKYSHGLARLAAIEAVRGSYEQVGEAIFRATGVRIGKRQAEQLAVAAAADVDAFYEARRPASSPGDVLLVMQFDGKGIVMRPEALRAATAKAAAGARRKLATRLSPGEKNGRKRMAELGRWHRSRSPPPGTARHRPPCHCTGGLRRPRSQRRTSHRPSHRRSVLHPRHRFSYGFRPGRSQHDALDALAVGLGKRVNWVLDADIRGFLDPWSYCSFADCAA